MLWFYGEKMHDHIKMRQPMAYGDRDSARCFRKIKAGFPGNP